MELLGRENKALISEDKILGKELEASRVEEDLQEEGLEREQTEGKGSWEQVPLFEETHEPIKS